MKTFSSMQAIEHQGADATGGPPGRRRALGVLMLIGAAVGWSLAGLSVKTVRLPPESFTFYRSLFAAGAMGLAAMVFRGGRRPHAGWMAASALVYVVVVTSFVAAMTLGTAAMGIMLQYTAPLYCALLAWLVEGRRIGRRTLVALGFACVGIAIMIIGQPRDQSIYGPIFGIISGIAFGSLFLVLEKVDRATGSAASVYQIVMYNNIGTALILGPLLLIMGSWRIEAWQLGIVAVTAVVQLSIPYVLFQFALRRVSPVDAALLVLLEPVLNPIWVAIFTTERPNLLTCIGGAAILMTLVIEATKGRNNTPAAARLPNPAPQHTTPTQRI